jgi:sialate O-acetylesterase
MIYSQLTKFFSSIALLAVILIEASPLSLQAGVKLASYFGDNMVLQRNCNICVWGTGDPNTMVTVTLGTRRVVAQTDANGGWEAFLKPMTVGGPLVLTATDGNSTFKVSDVLIGDVWLCSGQSNMQMPTAECVPPERQLANTPHATLRFCTVAKSWKDSPQLSAGISWTVCTPQTANGFSAVGFFFANELLKDPALERVPMAVIDSSFGGTTCEGWIPQTALAAFNTNELHDSMFGIKPSMLYNAMIAPLGKASFKGVIWYQGESNSGHPDAYPRLLSTLVREWRKQMNEPALPFFIVQLPDYASQWDGFYWPWEREAQSKAVATISNATLIVAINTTDGFDLHPKTKLEIGRRIAIAVRDDVYHEQITGSGPIFRDAKSLGPSMRVTFDTRGDGLSNSCAGDVRGFAVAGDDGVYHFARVQIDGNDVVVQSDAVPAPKTIRYAWSAVPNSTLINKAGLPASPFRTDDFPYSNIEVQNEPISHQMTTPVYKMIVDGEGMVSSFCVGNAQFISNDPGMAGGSSIPGPFGPIALPDDQELGPQILSCSNGNFIFLMTFADKSMEWHFTNRGKDDVKFDIALSPRVGITREKADEILLKCKNSSVTITGIDSIADSDDEKKVEIVIKGNAVKNLLLKVN